MTITLQVSTSPKNKLDKDVSDVASLSGTLKTSTSVINPSIIIEGDLSQYTNVNYMTIAEFGRSYFITNITSVTSKLFEIAAHVDVLSSFAAEIRANKAIVHRQETKWNLYLDDGSFKVYQNPMVLTKAFPSGFTTQEFVLAVAGG